MGRLGLFGMFASLVISTFTVSADRIYVVCYRDAETCYVYDENSVTYRLNDDGSLTEIVGASPVDRRPALQYIPMDSEIVAKELLPGAFEMSFESVCSYLTRMSRDGYELRIVLQTPDVLEGTLSRGSDDYRFIASSEGVFRIYSKDIDNISMEYTYINKE